ncbi:hypothetical protein KAX97_14925 [candidate division WOR-3 bacterium]|nr:hypothetical protein [candidate division WOR-3 bacterium]
MNRKLSFNLSFKECIVGFIVLVIIILLGNWTYFFLPAEYAEKAQFPNMESVLTVTIAFLWVLVYKSIKKINEIEKRLDEKINTDNSKLGKSGSNSS